MHLELVELLRCPKAHAPSVLVASADVIFNRSVTEGLLGCPECYSEYAIRGGVTHFVTREPTPGVLESPPDRANREETLDTLSAATRLAAQLGLSEGRSVFALVGYDITTIAAMSEIVAARVLLFNPAQLDANASLTEQLQNASLRAPVGVVTFGDTLPVVPAKFDGIAVRTAYASPSILAQAANALRSGGRLVADARTQLPAGVRELVRDEHVWVAERESVASVPISIVRR